MASKPRTKPGAHGTLYRYAVMYKGAENDPGALPDTWYTWAYNPTHAEERFFDGPDEGWRVLDVSRVYERVS